MSAKTKKKAVALPFRSLAYRKMLAAAQKKKLPGKRRHIEHEGGKWVLYSHDGKVLGKHDTREDAVKQEEAVKAQEGKALEESSGEGGGYVVPEEEERKTKDEEGASGAREGEDVTRLKDAIGDVADSHHEDGALPGHAYHLHPESKDIHHEHPAEESPERLEAIKSDLEALEGAGKVTQGTEPPAEDAGFAHTYRTHGEDEHKDMDGDGDADDAGGMEEKSKKGCSCHQKKGWQKKDMADGDPNAPQGDGDFEPEPPTGQPHGAGAAQHLIEFIEGQLESLEPECQEFFRGLLEQTQAWAAERYPDLEFGGGTANATGGEGGTPNEKATEEALERYQELEGKKLKALLKALDAHPQGQHFREVVDGAAEHLHDLARLPEKSFSARHQKHCLLHARALDKVHGMLTKDAGEETIEKPGDGEVPTEEKPTRTEEEGGGGSEELDTKAILASVEKLRSEARASQQDFNKKLYQATGKK